MNTHETEEVELASRLFHFGIGFIFRIDGIIRIIVVNKPDLFRDVEVADDVKRPVIEWLLNPHPCSREEWDKVHETIDRIGMNLFDLIIESGNVPENLFIAYLQRIMNKTSFDKTASGTRKQGGVFCDQRG